MIYDDPNHLHAVSGTLNGETYDYDDNGNMPQRNVLENTQTLTYDGDAPERRQAASRGMPGFMRTRPGNRVTSVVYGAGETVTTYYVGMYYEKIVTVDGGGTTTAWKKYYYAGASRLAIPRRCASGTLCGRIRTTPST